ncbi:MAG TPA: hypothetical protein VGV64_01395 [Thermoplasmata archaeon]|nr:hypothetical protein [Thermoplasmata archaeon]HEV2519831.1 hypothetical protein [Thermoplasmata archaeon]
MAASEDPAGPTDAFPILLDRQILGRCYALLVAMALLFGPSLRERSLLVRTVHALGPTSIDGLAAALSWSPRRTERLVSTLARRGEGGIWYSAALRQVRVGPPPPPPEAGPDPSTVASDHQAPSSERILQARGPPSGPVPEVAPPALPQRRDALHKCPKCAATMEMLGDHQSLVCPRCGRLSLAPRPGSPAGGSTRGPASEGASGSSSDRRSQEMLAAYVTARPIPCPRCRSPLRHEGPGKFRCVSCGSAVTFGSEGLAPPPLPAPAVAAAR